MKRGTFDHPKVLDLQAALNLDELQVIGLLERLWHFTATYAPAGDIGRWPDTRIASGVAWRGNPAALVGALCDTRWCDADSMCRVRVHDWFDHADDAVNLRLARAGKLFADGNVPKLNRLSKQERETIEEKFRAHGKRTKSARRAHANAHEKRTPCALPEPSPPLPSQALPSHITKTRTGARVLVPAREAVSPEVVGAVNGVALLPFDCPRDLEPTPGMLAMLTVAGCLDPAAEVRLYAAHYASTRRREIDWTETGPRFPLWVARHAQMRCVARPATASRSGAAGRQDTTRDAVLTAIARRKGDTA